MGTLAELLDHLELLLGELELVEPGTAAITAELLDGVDALHRLALRRLASGLSPAQIAALREDEVVAWLFDAYAIGVDERTAAEAALDEVRPYISSHGGSVEVLDVDAGTVRLKMSGACSGCTSSTDTLRNEIERVLRDRFPGFDRLEVEPDGAAAHPPPAVTPVQLSRRGPDHS